MVFCGWIRVGLFIFRSSFENGNHNLSQKWHPNRAVFQRKFRKIANVDYRTSVWYLLWLLRECHSPEWVARVLSATHWEIPKGPLSTVDRLPRKRNK